MADIVLSDTINTNRYGRNWSGAIQYNTGFTGSFDYSPKGVTLRFAAYDIDNINELEVLLNGASIGFVQPTGNNTLSDVKSYSIPESSLIPGENVIEFRKDPNEGGIRWGVTSLSTVEGAEGAVMVLRSTTNPGGDDTGEDYKPGVWRKGEVVHIGEVDAEWAFTEMPINDQGIQSIATINGLDPAVIPLYAHIITSDAGTITQGNQSDFDVEAGTSIVWQFGDVFKNFGVRSDTTPGDFYHIRVEDKTVAEVNLYLELFNVKLSYQTDQFNPADDMRRWTTTNLRVSASGNNGFTAQGIQDVIAAWNAKDPLDPEVEPNPNPITLVDTDNLTYFQCDGVMPVEVFTAWQETTQAFAFSDIYARRRWYITQAGLNALAANEGLISGTASEVSPFLRDGLID